MNNWISIHLHTMQNFDHFIRGGIRPVLETLETNFGIKRYFFIRYFERGPHIRLRVYMPENTIENDVRKFLSEYFLAYFKKKPFNKAMALDLLNKVPNSLPTENFYFGDYKPEYERYGGIEGVHLAEEVFVLSSRVVMQKLDEALSEDYSECIGTAIKMHIVFLYQVLTRHEIIHVLNNTIQMWIKRATRSGLEKQGNILENADVLRAFERSFIKERENLTKIIRNFWALLEDGTEIPFAWLDEWSTGLKNIKPHFDKSSTILISKIVLPLPFEKKELPGSVIALHKRWYLFDSYIHMTNNRLGITNRDESFIAYIIMRVFESENL